MATLLTRFLADAGRRGFIWGQHDCMLFVADWALKLTGVDPGAPWRGTYASAAEAAAILARFGGPGPLLHHALTPSGWWPVHECEPGDIAVVRAPTRTNWALNAAIFEGRGRFCLLTERGTVHAPAPFMLGWRHQNASACHG